jgi:hypothetical protein
VRPAAEKLGIRFPGFGWHTFRRMNLTLIQEAGATPVRGAGPGRARQDRDDQALHDGQSRTAGQGGPAAAAAAAEDRVICAQSCAETAG